MEKEDKSIPIDDRHNSSEEAKQRSISNREKVISGVGEVMNQSR